jgi:hypothetical protein
MLNNRDGPHKKKSYRTLAETATLSGDFCCTNAGAGLPPCP